MMKSLAPRRSLATLALLLALLAAAHPSTAAATTGATLRFDPTFAQARQGQTVRLEVWVDNAENLNRVEFTASYDPAQLEPLDAIPDQEGVQLEIGSIFADGYTPQNEAGEGLLQLVAARFPADGPFAGQGMVAAITFQVLDTASPGLYPVAFDPASVQLLDPDGNPVTLAGLTDGSVRVPPVATAIDGWITREGTSAYGRTAVTAFFYPGPDQPPVNWARACTDEDGNFLLPVPEGEGYIPPDIAPPLTNPPEGPYEWVFVRLEFPNHGSECYWEPLDDEVVHIGWHTLEGGDVNEDGCINIFDIVRIIGDFGETASTPCFVPFASCPASNPPGSLAPASDINGDCQVNIFDLTMAAENFGLCSNCH